jgi:2-(1,2-epoxy-1,2-dihydrophenyl)acetyl-CoA isomerase
VTEYEHLSVERAEGVVRIVMDRPATNNAMDRAMAAELRTATANVVNGDSRCVVLTGSEDVFNTGADLSVLDGDGSDARTLRKIASSLHRSVENLVGARKPVVTAVNGVAAGGGFGLALAGDLVVVAADGRFEFAYPRVGLTGDGGSTFFLPRLVGLRRAKEIALLDEPIDAERAVAMGLATEAVSSGEFDERVAELAADLSDGPTRAYARTKRLLTESAGRGLSTQMAAETDAIARMTRTDDYERGLAAFFGDGDPAFEGR